MPNRVPPNPKLFALVAAGLLAFNYPLLSLFSGGETILGVPLSFFYVGLAWLLFVILLAAAAQPFRKQRRDHRTELRSVSFAARKARGPAAPSPEVPAGVRSFGTDQESVNGPPR